MERCPRCRSDLDAVDYLEPDLFGRVLHIVIVDCPVCGWSERTVTELAPVPV